MTPSDCFKQKGDNLLWEHPQSAADTALKLLIEARPQSPYKSQLMVVPLLMTLWWRKYMGKEADFLFTVPFEITCWGLE